MNQQQPKVAAILTALAAIRNEIDYIKKDKKVDTYTAVTHDQVTAHTRDLFRKHGVLIAPSVVGTPTTHDTGGRTSKEWIFIRTECVINVRFISVDDGTHLDLALPAHAVDQGDKGPGKAISYAVKYAILKVLQIETGDDEEGREVADHHGLPVDTFVDFETKIGDLKKGDDPNPLWQEILKACQKYGDRSAATRLRAKITAKAESFKEGAGAAPSG